MGGSVSSLKELDTVTKRLQHLSESNLNKELYVFYNSGVRDAYTSRRLYTLAGRFAHRLRQHGFQKGDVIGNTLNNSPERVVTDLGIMLAGCVALNIQLLLADGSDFLQSVKNCKCRAVIMSTEKTGPAWKLISKFICGKSLNDLVPILVENARELTSAILIDREEKGMEKDFLKDLAMSNEDVFVCPAESDDLLVIVTTSGSTGYSKLVPKTHAQMLRRELIYESLNPLAANRNSSKETQFKYYNDVVLGWSAGLPYGPICHGDTRVMFDVFGAEARKTGRDIFEVFTREDIRVAMMLCSELDLIREYLESVGGTEHRLKLIFTGGQPLRKKQMETFFTLSEELVIFYASTETGILSKHHLHKGDILESNNNGKTIEGVKLRIVSDEGKVCQPYETGTIEATGPGSFQGYFNRLETTDPQTLEAFTSDGWVKLGDYGHLNNDGNVFVYGRTKDIIVHGGNLFYPGWMEERLMEHPGILEAFVVPVSDPVMYQNICACVKLRQDSNLDEVKLKEYCDTIFLPNLVEDDLPKPNYFMLVQVHDYSSGRPDTGLGETVSPCPYFLPIKIGRIPCNDLDGKCAPYITPQVTNEGFPETATGKPSKLRLRQMAEEMFGSVKNIGF